ncbi:laccase-14-like [Salvia hispanica]|uniref:laccase-14-like n=1 Tax=Salvia hispanica TaxID=49212 RepID=UPI0020095782|nr:laccase-14-like [Salvia hispanica]
MFSAAKVFMLCFLAPMILLNEVTLVHAIVRSYKFELVNSLHTKLCSNKTMLTINGQSPGPTIYARRGDLVVVDTVNRADQNITIHWHGVKMPRNPWSDGTNYVTQCPIQPGKRFRQRVILSDEEGTLWWHAHSDWSRNSVYGAIVILPPKRESYPFPKPHAHVPILIGEWWKGDMQKVMEDFLGGGGNPAVSDAFLINGQPGDLYPCSTHDTYKLSVEFGKTYLLRVINAVMDYIMFFQITNHTFTVVGTDGAYTKPLQTDYVAISPGQTIDLLLEANQPPDHYYMGARIYLTTATMEGGKYMRIPTTGIIQYVGIYTPSPPLLPTFPEYDDTAASYHFTSMLRSRTVATSVPDRVEKRLFFTLSINLSPCTKSSCVGTTRLMASMNNITTLLPTDMNVLEAYYRGIRGVYETGFPEYPARAFNYTEVSVPKNESASEFRKAVIVVEYGTAVEVVFQATNFAQSVDHPMHLHGHSFYVVGSGIGDFDPIKDPPKYNLVDPPLMQNIAVPRGGWTAIRFKTNNPGVWFMHCHFERHMSWGMKVVFIVKDGERADEKMLPPPADMPSCGGQVSSPTPLVFGAILGKKRDEVE